MVSKEGSACEVMVGPLEIDEWCGQEEDAKELVDAMVENSALESLVQRLSTFNEASDEEALAVTNTLSIFENMVELSPGVRTPIPTCYQRQNATNVLAEKPDRQVSAIIQ